MAKIAKNFIEYRVYELPLDFPLVYLSGEKWHISEVKSKRLHFHNCLEIGICHTDSGFIQINNEELSFEAGDVTCIPRNVPHTTYSSPHTKSLWSYIFVDLSLLLTDTVGSTEYDIPSDAISNMPYVFKAGKYDHLCYLVNKILRELTEHKADRMQMMKPLFQLFYYELCRALQASRQESGSKRGNAFSLAPALESIHQDYMSKLSITALANLCHMSEPHFRRVFLSIMGSSPLSFINAVRIQHACSLLLTSDESILSIAESVGFSTISCFNRAFLKAVGVSPREYRNHAAGANKELNKKFILEYKGWTQAEALEEAQSVY